MCTIQVDVTRTIDTKLHQYQPERSDVMMLIDEDDDNDNDEWWKKEEKKDGRWFNDRIDKPVWYSACRVMTALTFGVATFLVSVVVRLMCITIAISITVVDIAIDGDGVKSGVVMVGTVL